MNFLYIPICYTFKTRLKNIVALFSWVVICPLLLFIILITQDNIHISLSLITCYIFSFLHTYNLYEIGYIINDTETIKKEKEPTLRLSYTSLNYYYTKRIKIYLIRLMLSATISLILLLYYHTPLIYIFYSWLIIPVYLIYNNIRNIFNLPIHFILVILRYTSPLVLSMTLTPSMFFIIILIFPLINLIERASEKRFNINFLIQKRKFIEKFRFFYYLVILLLIVALQTFSYPIPNYFFIITTYMLLYRLLSPIIINKLRNKKND